MQKWVAALKMHTDLSRMHTAPGYVTDFNFFGNVLIVILVAHMTTLNLNKQLSW